MLGRYNEAIAKCQKALSADKENPIFLAQLGYSYAVAGKHQEALKILEELRDRAKRQYITAHGLVLLYIGLRENDKAIAALQEAFA